MQARYSTADTMEYRCSEAKRKGSRTMEWTSLMALVLSGCGSGGFTESGDSTESASASETPPEIFTQPPEIFTHLYALDKTVIGLGQSDGVSGGALGPQWAMTCW